VNTHPQRPVILDGGLSTQIQIRGGDTSGSLWSARALLDTPEVVQEAHLDFVRAGSDVVITASYQVSRQGFLAAGLEAVAADEALRTSVVVARNATAGLETRVAASVGPYGAILHDGSEYRGNYGQTQEFLEAFHRERLEVLAHASPDFFAVETIPDVLETTALARVLAEMPEIPAWFSFTARDEAHLASGEPIEDAIAVVADLPNLYAVGVNCVAPECVEGLISRIRASCDASIIVYPNSGGVWSAGVESWSGDQPLDLTHWWDRWRNTGIDIIGGCCGVDAGDIQKLSRSIAS